MKTNLLICLLLILIVLITLISLKSYKDHFYDNIINNNKPILLNKVKIGTEYTPNSDFINNQELEIGVNSEGGSVNSNNPIMVGTTPLTAEMIRKLKQFYYPYFKKNGEYIPGSIFKASTKGKWKGVNIDMTGIPKTETASYNREFKKKCDALGTDHKVNETQLVTGNNDKNMNINYPGCGIDSCCKMINPPVQTVYDELCFGDKCINGDDLKLLTSDNIFNLKSDISGKCLDFSSNSIKLQGSYARDSKYIKFASETSCPVSTSESRTENNWIQLWPGDKITSIDSEICDGSNC
jgi:hypothetical protein